MHLTTERLAIRPWRLDEAPRLLDILSRVEVVRWLGDGEPVLMADVAEAEERITSQNAMTPPLGVWAIAPRDGADTGVPAGTVMLVEIPDSSVDGGDPLVQIGWNLHPDSVGKGYASEAATAVLAQGLANGLDEIRALMHLDNHPSIAVARRIGMRYVGVTHDWYESPSEVFVVP